MAYRVGSPQSNLVRRIGEAHALAPARGLGRVPGSLGFVPPLVKIDGIPNPVSAPAASSRTWRRVKIPRGAMGTLETMKVMAQMALESATDPVFIDDARSVLRSCAGRDYRCYMAADLDYVRARVKYLEGPIGEDEDGEVPYQWLQSPGWTMYVSGQGLCADMATLEAGIGLAQGLGAMLRGVFLDRERPNEASHVYALLRGKSTDWLAVDPVPPGSVVGFQPPESLWLRPPLDLVIAVP